MARHAYFRNPHGGAYQGTDGKHSPVNILKCMGESSFIDGNGGVGWRGFPFAEYNLALESSFVVLDENQEELSESDAHAILWKALTAIAKKTPGAAINPADLLREANTAAGAFLHSPRQNYVLVTSLSLARFPAKSAITLHDSAISPALEAPGGGGTEARAEIRPQQNDGVGSYPQCCGQDCFAGYVGEATARRRH
jgi:hypothetical protein